MHWTSDDIFMLDCIKPSFSLFDMSLIIDALGYYYNSNISDPTLSSDILRLFDIFNVAFDEKSEN